MVDIVDTNGGRTVAAATWADVNAALQAQGKVPPGFKCEALDQSFSADFTFGKWGVTAGDSRSDIRMTIEITGGAVCFGPLSSLGKPGSRSIPVNGATATIEVRARYLSHTDKLTLVHPVWVLGFDHPPTENRLASVVVYDMLEQWLNENLDLLGAVLTSAGVDAAYDKDGVKRLKPASRRRAVEEPATHATLDSPVIVDTNGWHTVAAVTYADVNAAIQANSKVPPGFKCEAPDLSESADCTFGKWGLTTGGSGPNFNMKIEITGGTVCFGPLSSLGKPDSPSFPVNDATATITVRAKYLPHTDRPTLHHLVLDDQSPVTVDSFDHPPTKNRLASAALKDMLEQWLNKNLNVFGTVFASVDLDAAYDKDGVKWLKPSYKGYAVEEPAIKPTLDNSVFAVLCLVDDTPPPPQLSYQVSAFAIPDGARAAFLISGDKFLQHMMLQAVPLMFSGIKNQPPTDNFAITNSGTQIDNTKDLQFTEVKLDNGNTVNPDIGAKNFSLKIDAQQLAITVTDMTFEAFPGVTVHFDYVGRSTLFYDKTKNLLDLKVVVQSGGCTVEVSKGYRITEYITAGIAIVGGIMGCLGGAGGAAEGAATSESEATITATEVVGQDDAVAEQVEVEEIGGVINDKPTKVSQIAGRWQSIARVGALSGAMAGTVGSIMGMAQAFSQSDYQSMPKITDLTDAAIGKTVIWPKEVGDFVLDSAQLNGCLQFGLVKKP